MASRKMQLNLNIEELPNIKKRIADLTAERDAALARVDAAEARAEQAERAAAPLGYVVVHEWPHPSGELVYRDTAGSIWPNLDRVVNHLAYCHGMQEQQRPGSEGRYFIAEVREAQP